MKYAVSILKPDCLQRKLVGTVKQILLSSGLKILLQKKFRFDRKGVEIVYNRCMGLEFFEGLTDFLTSSDSIALLVEDADNAIRKLNSVVGNTNPKLAKPGTIRSLGEDIRYNLAHSTADEQAFWREVRYIFTKNELQKIGLS
ncbi:hypothetical protein HZB04_04110 [Candidatus Wolfebacteria bacterium]|nr:hypothetical protein [Candidatus Wolfebacteria bacterium]